MAEAHRKNTFSGVETLSARVDELIEACEHLREENRVLRKQLTTIAAERAGLAEKNAQVQSRVEAMISRLKAME
jgi:cell division protein ZapB